MQSDGLSYPYRRMTGVMNGSRKEVGQDLLLHLRFEKVLLKKFARVFSDFNI